MGFDPKGKPKWISSYSRNGYEELTFTDPQRQAFYESHGDFIVADDHEILFEDGAIEEVWTGGQRIRLPKDAFERAKQSVVTLSSKPTTHLSSSKTLRRT